nr:hypothetical protein [Tanacetum cinerariifolium]
EIKSLKHTLSEYLKENESLEQKITILKDDFQKEESRNIDRELASEKKAQQLKPNLYDGSVIRKSDVIVVPDSENTLMHAEESQSKMIEKQNDPQMIEKKVITKPIDYAILNQLSTDFNTRFVPQTESYTEQAFWSQYSVQTDEPNHFGTTIVDVPKELPKVSMALGFQNPRYLKKAQQLKPNMYDGSIIGKYDVIVVPDSENTIMHAEESRSKMIAKQNDPQLIEKKIESYAEQASWSQYSVQTDEPSHSGTTIVVVPKELPKVSM